MTHSEPDPVPDGGRRSLLVAERLRHNPSFARAWWLLPLAIFLATRVVEGIVLTVMGRHQIPEPADYTRPVPLVSDPPTYLHLIANWDGQQYRAIVHSGYPEVLPRQHGVVVQNAWAFYPLFPALVRLVMLARLSFGWSASVVSISCGAVAMCLLFRLLERSAGRYAAALAVLALCTCAAAITLQAAYTESLALLLVTAGLTALRARHYGWVLTLGLLLSLTRPVVPAMAAVVFLHWLGRRRRAAQEPFPRAEQVRVLAVSAAILASFGLWPAIAWLVTGEPDAYFATQRAWVLDGHGGWPSWLASIFGTDTIGSVDLTPLAIFALVVWAVVLLRPSSRAWGPELRSWAFAYPLYILVATRPTTSIFRYAMLTTVMWWPFPEIDGSTWTRRRKAFLAAGVATFGLLTQVVWLHWFFVVSPAALSYP